MIAIGPVTASELEKFGIKAEYFWFPKSKDFYNFLSSCNVGAVTSSNDLPRRMGPPVKLFDYLSVGLPVVANDIGGWTKIIKEEEVGLLTDNNPRSFANGILKLLEDADLSYEFGKKGLELVKTKLNWDHSAQILLQKYEEMLA